MQPILDHDDDVHGRFLIVGGVWWIFDGAQQYLDLSFWMGGYRES